MIIPSVFGSEGVLWCDSIMLCHYVHVAQFLCNITNKLFAPMNSIFDGRFLKIMFFTFRKNISLELNVLLRNGLVCHNVHSKLYTAVRKH